MGCVGTYSFPPYTVFPMFGMLLHYVVMIDLAVFNNKVSVHVLVCGRMVQEVLLYLDAVMNMIMMIGYSRPASLLEARA